MIKNISSVSISTPDHPMYLKPVPMIPASGKYSSEITPSAAGRLNTVTAEFKVTKIIPEMHRDIILTVTFDDRSQTRLGTPDRPARLEIKSSDVIRVSYRWEHPCGF